MRQNYTAYLYYGESSICVITMLFVYFYFTNNPNLFSLLETILGVILGYLISQISNAKNESKMNRILNTALIKEKAEEVKSVEELRNMYQNELNNLRSIIEDESSRLLLNRLREVYISDIKEKINSIDAIDLNLKNLAAEPHSNEIIELRTKIDALLLSVQNPEEDDRIVRQTCYSLPFLGNAIYIIYSFSKLVSPKFQRKIHSLIFQLKELEFKATNILILFILFLVIMVIALTASLRL